jgi:hypothetical protein
MRRTLLLPVGASMLWCLMSGCGNKPGIEPRAPYGLNAADFTMWHSLRRLLIQGDLQGSGVSAICVGMGEDGNRTPSSMVLADFLEVEPPVVSVASCARTGDSGWEILGPLRGKASLVSFVDVDSPPGSPRRRASVRVELPGRTPEHRICEVEDLGMDRGLGDNPPPAMPRRRPSRIRAQAQCWVQDDAPIR